jgi:hypothetical protein
MNSATVSLLFLARAERENPQLNSAKMCIEIFLSLILLAARQLEKPKTTNYFMSSKIQSGESFRHENTDFFQER